MGALATCACGHLARSCNQHRGYLQLQPTTRPASTTLMGARHRVSRRCRGQGPCAAGVSDARTDVFHSCTTDVFHSCTDPTDRHTGRRVRSSSSTEATGASHKRARERGARERGARERSKRGRSKRGDQTQRRPPAPRPAPLLPPPRRLLLVHVCVPRKCVPWPTLWPTVPPPTDPVGQSWPRGTRSVGDSVGEGYYSVKHIAVLLECETPSSADARSGADARKSCIVQAQAPPAAARSLAVVRPEVSLGPRLHYRLLTLCPAAY